MKNVFALWSVVLTAVIVVVLAVSLALAQQVVVGTNGPDLIRGNQVTHGNPAQVIYALGGDDIVFGGKGADAIYGSKGNDKLNAYHASADYVSGGPGADKCILGGDPETGATNDTAVGCEKVVIKDRQGHGSHK